MTVKIEIPKSYLDYVNHLQAFAQVDGKQALPPNFSWEDIQAYHKAQFSLNVIKYKYYIFLNELWEETWRIALNDKTTFIPCTEEAYTRLKANHSPEDVWKGVLARLYTCGSICHWFAISANSEAQRIHLYWYAQKENEDISSKLSLNNEVWNDFETNGWRITKDDCCNFKDYNDVHGLNYSELCNAAQKIIEIAPSLEK